MKTKVAIFICILAFFTIKAYSQEDWGYTLTEQDNEIYLEQAKNAMYMPKIGIGRGVFTFLGDVKDNQITPVSGRTGTKIDISRKILPYLNLDLSLLQGKITGNQNTPERNLNFQTEALCGGISIQYNFQHLFKQSAVDSIDGIFKPKLRPYIGIGLESFEFNSKADMKDANGNDYYFWSDGTIRNMSESADNETQSIMLQRDYTYETDLRELDNDGLGKYKQIALALPIDLGARMDITKRLSCKLGVTLHYSFTDVVDNVSSKGKGSRKGSKAKDMFLFSYVSVHYDLFHKPVFNPYGEVIEIIDAKLWGDEDGDNILDILDECPFTETGVVVNVKGCPLDDDEDGIPNLFDEELKSAPRAIVDLQGVTMLEDVVGDTTAIAHRNLYFLYPSLNRNDDDPPYGNIYLEIPDKFKKYDLNKDDYISNEEIYKVIDAFFDFSIDITIDELYELNDFFFEQ